MRDEALSLAAQNFRVFPVKYGQKVPPLWQGWQNKATTDAGIIKKAWSDGLGDEDKHNIGIVTGRGLLVLDFDTKKGKKGLESLKLLDSTGLPESRRVTTPTGSVHVYLSVPEDMVIPGRKGKVLDGMDVQGHHNYVVAPGSVIEGEDGGVYTVTSDNPIEPAPAWLLKLLGTKTLPASGAAPKANGAAGKVLSPLDTSDAVARAWAYLQTPAAQALEGQDGSKKTFNVARIVRSYGISHEKCMELMLDWNQLTNGDGTPDELMIGAEPAWELTGLDSLETRVKSAYTGAHQPVGVNTVWGDFEALGGFDVGKNPFAKQDWPKPTPVRTRMQKDIPPREWVVEGTLAKRFLTVLTSPGGAGKTQWLAQLALSVASGSAAPTGLAVSGAQKVWYWNQEDDADELDRRIAAGMKCNALDWNEIDKNLFIDSGVEKPLIIAKRDSETRQVIAPAQVDNIIRHLRNGKFDAFIVDPLIEVHELNENDNVEIRAAAAVLRRIAVEANVAVCVAHHSRKHSGDSSEGHAGNADSARGASALQGVARIMITIYNLSENDAKKYGIAEKDRHLYARMDGAKSNLSLVAGGAKPSGLKRISVKLENGETVGALMPVVFTEPVKSAQDDAEIVFSKILEIAGPDARTTWSVIRAALVAAGIGSDGKWLKWLQRLREENGDKYMTIRGAIFSQSAQKRNESVVVWVEVETDSLS